MTRNTFFSLCFVIMMSEIIPLMLIPNSADYSVFICMVITELTVFNIVKFTKLKDYLFETSPKKYIYRTLLVSLAIFSIMTGTIYWITILNPDQYCYLRALLFVACISSFLLIFKLAASEVKDTLSEVIKGIHDHFDFKYSLGKLTYELLKRI